MAHIVVGNGTTATTNQDPGAGFNLVLASGGSIITTGNAIIADGNNKISISGEVIAMGGTALQIAGGSVSLMVNAGGSLTSMDGFVAIYGAETGVGASITNYGTIGSDNDGFASTALSLNTGNDTVINRGVITGEVALGGGNDVFDGRGGTVRQVSAGNGNDSLMIDAVQDTILESFDGGTGTDTLNLSGTSAAFWVDLQWVGVQVWTSGQSIATGANANTMIATLSSVENIVGSLGSDMVYGNASGNAYQYTGHTGTVVDFFDGRAGSDTIDLSKMTSAIWVDLNFASNEVWSSGGTFATAGNANTADLNLANVENVLDTGYLDTIFGSAADNTIGFTSRIVSGLDYYDGRGGSDTVDFSASTQSAWVDLAYSGIKAWSSFTGISTSGNAIHAIVDLISFENVTGSSGSDTILGDALDNRLDGFGNYGGGTELINGRGGDDTFVFKRDYNALRIEGFQAGQPDDQIEMSGFGAAYDTFAEVYALGTQNGADTVFDFGMGEILTLANVVKTNLTADDFLFV